MMSMALDRTIGATAKGCSLCRLAGKSKFRKDVPTCQRIDGCVAPLSEVKLSHVDSLILKLFIKVPWREEITMSKAGIIRRSIIWTDAESIARGMRIPWSPYVIRKLELCESIMLKQEDKRIEMVTA